MKIEYVTLDSSFLVSFLFPADCNHYYSRKLMDYAFKNNFSFLMPIVVLFEVFHTLNRLGFFKEENNHAKFRSVLDFDSFKYFDLNMSFFNMFKDFPFFNKLKTSDAIIAASALINKSILISWDKRLLENSWEGYTPEAFLKKFAKT